MGWGYFEMNDFMRNRVTVWPSACVSSVSVGFLGPANAARRGGVEDPNMLGATPSNDHRQLGGLDPPP